MSRAATERSVPDVRDIFTSVQRCKDKALQTCNKKSSGKEANKKKSVQHIIEDSYDRLKMANHKTPADDTNEKNRKNRRTTITERDLRHLERRLSMKKTIRKQISRNLAQAFIDDPNITTAEGNSTDEADDKRREENKQTCSSKDATSRCLTINQSKVSKCEPTVLDMLKDCEEDERGRRNHDHASFANENDVGCKQDRRNLTDDKCKQTNSKKPFWKLFSAWNKK